MFLVDELGVIVSYKEPPTHLSFCFQLNEKIDVKVGEFVEVPAGKYVIVGRIILVRSFNEYFNNPEFVRDHLARNLPIAARFPVDIGMWREAKVEIVSMFEGNKVHPPSVAPEPGERVYRASPEVLRRLLGLKSDGLFIGTMYGNDNLRVLIDAKALTSLHFAIFGATGSGKSYTVGVIVEELLEKNYPVVIIDPHGEYSTFVKSNDEPREVFKLQSLGLDPRSYDVKVFRPAYFGQGNLTLNFDDLDTDTLAEMARLTPVMRDLLYLAIRDLRKNPNVMLTPENILGAINKVAQTWGFHKKTQLTLARNIMLLREMGIFGKGFDPRDLVEPGKVTIIDLSIDMEEHIRRIFAGAVMEKLFKARKEKKIPPLVVIVEESHRFAPQEEDTYSKMVMRRIAREGRKFGISIGVVSQRIVGLDKDVISQCGTKIILRIDSKTDLDYLRPYIGLASEEDIKRIPYLPTGVAIVTGVATRYPVLTAIRPRKSKHGGLKI